MKKFVSIFIFCVLLLSTKTILADHAVTDTTKQRTKKTNTIAAQPTPINTPFADGCPKIESVIYIIEEAISVGAPTYNDGNHAACFLIYKGAAYRIIYLHGSKCKQIKNILETALEKTDGNYNVTEKAWIMRMAFDQILGEPTKTTR